MDKNMEVNTNSNISFLLNQKSNSGPSAIGRYPTIGPDGAYHIVFIKISAGTFHGHKNLLSPKHLCVPRQRTKVSYAFYMSATPTYSIVG